jgi:hypothetical protein
MEYLKKKWYNESVNDRKSNKYSFK